MPWTWILLVALFLAALAVRAAWERRRARAVDAPASKIAFAGVFAAMTALWASWFSLVPRDPFRVVLPEIVSLLAMAVDLAGFVLAIGALAQLRGLEHVEGLRTRGLFSRLRHPMYVGFSCWILGWGLQQGALVSLLPGAVALWQIGLWARAEDRVLERRHGASWRAWRERTWF